MEIAYDDQALADLEYWRKSGNKSVQNKITQLIESIRQTPFEGIGKPEELKYSYTGKWSRRINQEHRLVYEVAENFIKSTHFVATIYNLKRFRPLFIKQQ